jgi:hypothetical protein
MDKSPLLSEIRIYQELRERLKADFDLGRRIRPP